MRKFVLGLLFFLFPLSSYCKPVFPALDMMEKIRSSFKNCTVDYKMICTYPSMNPINVSGKMGINGNQYFDSSNLRFVIFNDKWEIYADHQSKFIAVANYSALNKSLNGVATVSFSSFLFGGDFFSGNLKIVDKKSLNDSIWFSIVIDNQSVIEKFDIKLSKKTLKPISYHLKMNCPIKYMGTPYEDIDGNVEIEFFAENFISPAPAWEFNVDRVINEYGNKASLKRYGDYKSYLSNNKKKENE